MIGPTTRCSFAADNNFGPQVSGCDRFDFTLMFEEIVMVIGPLAILLLLTPFRLLQFRGRRKRVRYGLLIFMKLILLFLLTCLQLALLIVWAVTRHNKTRTSIPAALLAFAGPVVFIVLSYGDHVYSIHPSSILVTYLLFSVLFDGAHARTIWLIQDGGVIAALSIAAVVVKLLILLSELQEKGSMLLSKDTSYPPESFAGVINTSLFWWLNPLLKRGFGKELTMSDLFSLDDNLSSARLENNLMTSWKSLPRQKYKNSLLLVMIKVMKWPLLSAVIPRLCLTGFTFAQPFVLRSVVNYVSGPKYEGLDSGYGLIAAYFLVYVGIAISTAHFQHQTFRTITMVRGSLVSIIYRNTLDLSISAVDDSQPVTLMSTDVQRIATGMESIPDAWSAIIEIPLALYLLHSQLGVAFIASIIVSITCTLIMAVLGGLVGPRQKVWLESIQKRVGITVAALNTIKGIKITGLTNSLKNTIQQLRVDEINHGKKYRELLVASITLSYTTSTISPVLAFGIYTALAINRNDGSSLDINKAVTSLSLFALLAQPMLQSLKAIPALMSTIGAFDRIQKFLVSDCRNDPQFIGKDLPRPISQKHLQRIETKDSMQDKLASSVELESSLPSPHCNHGSKSLVIRDGFFGWDLNSIPVLKDINLICEPGTLTIIVGPVGSGKSTLLKAILGEMPKFNGTMELPSTEIAFCDQTPWLINGTLKENIVGFSIHDEEWYERVVNACALSKDIEGLPQGDKSLVGSRGSVLSGGQRQRLALARAVYSRKKLALLDDILSGLDSATEEQIFSKTMGKEGLFRQLGTTVILVTHATHLLAEADQIIVLGKDGYIKHQGTLDQFNATRELDNHSPKKDEKAETMIVEKFLTEDGLAEGALNPIATQIAADDAARRTGDFSLYLYYFRSIGFFHTFVFGCIIILFAFFFTFPTLWVQWFAASNEVKPNDKAGFYLGIYAFLSLSCLLFLLVGCCAPMSFFTNTDTGITSNRFSQDMELIDMELPISMLNASGALALTIAQLALIAATTKYIAVALPFTMAVFYFIQAFYLRTSRQLRFLDLEAKSPLYTNFIESLSGLASIRAYGWSQGFQDRNVALLNRSQTPFYLLYCVQRWLNLVLDLVVAGIAVTVVTLAITQRNSISPAFLGVALVNIISLAENLKSLITDWTKLETSIGAVARVKSFATETVSENLPGEDNMPPDEWPSKGRIEFDQVSATYGTSPTSNLILNQVSMTINNGEKVGICGRSGSGKSSLISCLFRMLDLTSGSIIIDGVNILTMPRQQVRSRIIALPQEPHLLDGTVRENVDMLGVETDENIISALKKVQLWELILEKGGLAIHMNTEFLSHGQKQLLCLARALLRKSTILVLDEATSNVDQKTDDVMHKIIREEFSNHTVVAIAHRLNTIIDFDKIALMEDGEMVEYDSPENLLGTNSKFAELYGAFLGRR